MKHQKGITENKIKTWPLLSIVFFLLSVLFVFTQTAWAQDKPFKIKGKDVKQYLVEKYSHITYLNSELKETPHGPKGSITISGEIPFAVEIMGKGKKERAQAIAKAFFSEEAALFGITSIEDLKVFKMGVDELGYTHITYELFIGDIPMENAGVRITITPQEKIRSVSVEAVPISPEVFEAVKKKTITKDEALAVMSQDLQSDGIDPGNIKILSIMKRATLDHPYVIWAVDVNLKAGSGGSRWNYEIDAFTGEVLKKIDALVY